jgi:hypothetical protein
MTRAREIASFILLAAAAVFALALEEPDPALAPLVAAVLVMPWRHVTRRRPRRWTRADLIAFLFTLAALALTLLVPDGVVRALIIAAIVSAYLASLLVLDPDR